MQITMIPNSMSPLCLTVFLRAASKRHINRTVDYIVGRRTIFRRKYYLLTVNFYLSLLIAPRTQQHQVPATN